MRKKGPTKVKNEGKHETTKHKMKGIKPNCPSQLEKVPRTYENFNPAILTAFRFKYWAQMKELVMRDYDVKREDEQVEDDDEEEGLEDDEGCCQDENKEFDLDEV